MVIEIKKPSNLEIQSLKNNKSYPYPDFYEVIIIYYLILIKKIIIK